MPERGRLFTDLFNEAGNALDETFSMLESLRSGKLSREELRDWYQKRRASVQKPVEAAYETGARVFDRMLPARRPVRRSLRRRRPVQRIKNAMRRAHAKSR